MYKFDVSDFFLNSPGYNFISHQLSLSSLIIPHLKWIYAQ